MKKKKMCLQDEKNIKKKVESESKRGERKEIRGREKEGIVKNEPNETSI